MVVNGATLMKRQPQVPAMIKSVTCPLKKHRRIVVPALHDLAHIEAGKRSIALFRSLLAKRQDRLWLSMVAVPLAITAAALLSQFWLLVPLAVLCCWWGSVEWCWAWLVGVMEACWGVQWSLIGIYGLQDFPRHRLLVGVLWFAYAGAVAAVGALNRWRYNRKSGW
jgi:hypothetical protein